ncbi:MAG: phosphoglycerate kinase [bacterium]|nr:phosphoglycerate kinase [bacterium]
MKIKSLKQKKKWQGERVLLRVDFNVPRVGKRISEDFRIKAALPTIEFLQKQGARLIVISHWGDPVNVDPELSTRALARHLQKLLGKPVKFVGATIGKKVEAAVSAMKDGDIIILENLRFESGEKKNDIKFAQALAALADVYVGDAFSVCHREQASVSAVTRYLPAYAGLQLEAELKNLEKIMKPSKPLVMVMGGAKISTKAPIIKKLYPLASQILLGGGLANTFLKYQGYPIGKSLHDKESKKIVAQFYKKGKLMPKIILPPDVIVCTKQGKSAQRSVKDVKTSDNIFDIGPDSVALFAKYIKKAHTIVWNGPLGKFEDAAYKHGTLAVGAIIAARSTGPSFGLVGGGETIEALKLTKMEEYIDWVSTAGGAMLSYLGGEKMPGLKNIISK